MKCRFEHRGNCCNIDSPWFLCSCEQPCDTIVPITNADRIRAMSDEDLAGYLIQYRDDWGDYCTPNCEFYDTYEEAKKATIKWLQQPAEGVE